MKAILRAPLALLLATSTLPAAAQAPEARPHLVAPRPARPSSAQDPRPLPAPGRPRSRTLRILGSSAKDPWQMERLGVAAVQKNELGKAREFFEESWKAGELPTAPYNLACLDAREGKPDAAFRQLDRAVAAGFDDEATLAKDTDLASLRARPEFARIVQGVKAQPRRRGRGRREGGDLRLSRPRAEGDPPPPPRGQLRPDGRGRAVHGRGEGPGTLRRGAARPVAVREEALRVGLRPTGRSRR